MLRSLTMLSQLLESCVEPTDHGLDAAIRESERAARDRAAGHAALIAVAEPRRVHRADRHRTMSGWAAALLLASTCSHPGCRVPARFCRVDHVVEWSDGRTGQRNAGIECGGHHRFNTERDERPAATSVAGSTLSAPTARSSSQWTNVHPT